MKEEFNKYYGDIKLESLKNGLFEVFEKGWNEANKKALEDGIYTCFLCKKCRGHHLYVTYGKYPKECPNCGEEQEENWLFVGYGNIGDFEK